MTRDLDWGVPVPVDGAQGKVMYVWFDAPIGYISATREIREDWKTWWQDPESQLTHFLGKDNIVFHTLIFPAMLHEHGSYILPTFVPANEFLNLEGQKLSTSRNHAVWLHDYLKDFPNREDELRYVLTAIMPETKDSDFTWKDYQARVNNELVAILGNWVNRVMILCQKYSQGLVPASNLTEHDDILNQADEFVSEINNHIRNFRFRDAQSQLMNIARLGNKFLQDTAPWHAIKEEGGQEKVESILRISLHLVQKFSLACLPFLPNTSEAIRDMLNTEEELVTGQALGEAKLLFQKAEDEVIDAQIDKLSNKTPALNEKEPMEAIKDTIQYDDFAKLDFRTGTIVEASKVEKADKLLQLQVDLGFETRTVVSGIAEFFDPKDIVGQQVVLVCNLAPRKLRGIESNGMILMAEDSSKKLYFVQPGEKIDPGSIVN